MVVSLFFLVSPQKLGKISNLDLRFFFFRWVGLIEITNQVINACEKSSTWSPALAILEIWTCKQKPAGFWLGRVLLNSHSFWVCQKTTTSKVCFFVKIIWVMLQYFFKARKTKVLVVSMSQIAKSPRGSDI